MKKWIYIALSIGFLASMNLGCSNQFRSVPVDDYSFVKASMEEVLGVTSSTTGEIAKFQELVALPGASLYYSDAPGPYGPVVSVASLSSFGFFDRPDLNYSSVAEIRIFFVDALTTEGRKSALLVALKEVGASAFEVKAFVGTRATEISDGEFIAVLGNSNQEKLTLRTLYLDENDELEAVVKMDVFDFSEGGLETYIGQFSTMVGFQAY